jgi:hypothetical protein
MGRETQVTKVINGELQAVEADGFAWSEVNAGRVAAVGNEREFQ